MSLSRRSFIGAAAAAFAAPYVITSAALGRGGRRAASERLTLGFIGTGIQGRGLLGSFLSRADTQCVAVCDVDAKRREDAKRRIDEHYGKQAETGYRGAEAYVDYREVLARADIDAVVIATPDHWHAIQIIAACKASKDIYCEKPLTLTLEEARRCMQAARDHGRVVQTGSQQRSEYDQKFIRAVEYVRNGRIGDLLSVQVGLAGSKVGPTSVPCDLPEEEVEPGLDWDRWLGPAPRRGYNSILSPRGVHNHYPEWRNYREYSGGMMTDWGAHNLDVAQWALDADGGGPVEVLPPRMPNAPYGARLVYPGGVEVVHAGPNGVTFIGTKGWLFVSRERLTASREEIVKDPLGDGETVRLPRPKDHHTDWIEAVRERGRPVADIEVGARTAACCHLMNLAYWHGRALEWNPATWTFPGDDQANAWRDYQRRDGYELPSA